MRILKLDQKNSTIKVVPEVLDDLWHLERIIEKGDHVSGSTDRKVKREELQKSERVKMFLKLEAEQAEFHRFSGQLRVQGKILEGKPQELVELGAHHALEIETGAQVQIVKKEWKQYQIKRLQKAKEATSRGKMLLCVLDDEQASFGILKEFELEEKGGIFSGRQGKMFAENKGAEHKYFQEILEKTAEIKPDKIVFAGPGFTKDALKKYIVEKQPFGKETKVFFGSTNSVGITGLQELLKNDILEKIVEEMQIVKETKMIESILQELGRGTGKAAIGIKAVQQAVEAGAVEMMLVNEQLLLEKNQKTEEIIKKAEQFGAEVHLVVSEHEAAKQLKGMGGIAAMLRYAMG